MVESAVKATWALYLMCAVVLAAGICFAGAGGSNCESRWPCGGRGGASR